MLQRHNAAYNPWRVSVPHSTFYTQMENSLAVDLAVAYNPWCVSVPRSTFYTQMINSPAVDLIAAYKLYAYFLFSGMTRRRPTRRLFKFWDGFVWEEKAECLLWGDLSKRHKLQHDLAQIDAGGRGRGLPPIPTL